MGSLSVPPSKPNRDSKPLNPNAEPFTPTKMEASRPHQSISQTITSFPHQIFAVPNPTPLKTPPFVLPAVSVTPTPYYTYATAMATAASIPRYYYYNHFVYYDVFSQPQAEFGGSYPASNRYHRQGSSNGEAQPVNNAGDNNAGEKLGHGRKSNKNKNKNKNNNNNNSITSIKPKSLKSNQKYVAKKPAETRSNPDVDDDILHGNTSLMIKNIPNQLMRGDLMKILDNHCQKENKARRGSTSTCASSYDFFYLPMDFRSGANRGYAFVNFTTCAGAVRFYNAFSNFAWEVIFNRKICQIAPSKFQGKKALSMNFKNSRFPCHTNEYLPVVLSPPSDGFNKYKICVVGLLCP